jgi:transposase-like protein
LCEAFDEVEEEGFVFISDREKGLILAVEEFFPQAVHAHCCNYIADNIAGDYGNKCKPLF